MKSFAEAIQALENGKRVRRHYWPDERIFVFKQVPAIIPAAVIPNMQSLPQTVKDYFIETFEDESKQIDSIYYFDQLAEVGLSNTIKSYSPSVTDVLTDDWKILD